MRKESSNQFTEGLVCDLNPINTPNTVLTDALNATIITYDGNEYSLQNDRGNYPLENCRLKPNYIPVGIKEYGDILYIVSYNPLDNRVEIGSYPSPMEVVGNTNPPEPEMELKSVIEKVDTDIEYSKLIELCETKIWTSANEEDSKLYPGDEYKISEEEPSPYKYETLEYYIVDENRQKYNISDLIEKDGKWHSVAWQIPGWLAAQYRIGTFDDFIMSVRSMKIPKLGEGKISGDLKLNFQLRISDFLFLPTVENDVKTDLCIRVNFEHLDDPIDIPLSEGEFVDWYKDSKILWFDWETHLEDLEFGDTVSFNATPVVKVNGKEIIYESFTESYSIYLNSIGSYSDFKIGEELWKFYIDEDDLDHLYLEYNITGPNITNADVGLNYRVLDLNGNPLNEWKTVNNYTGLTNQGVGILPFEDGFEKEAIYVLEFCFVNPANPVYKNTTKKLVIASQIFSDFIGEYDNFNDITFDIWVKKYKNSIKANNWNYTYSNYNFTSEYRNFEWRNDGNLYVNNTVLQNPSLRDIWSSKTITNKGILTDNEYNSIQNEKLALVQGTQGKPIITVENDLNVLHGKLWNNTPAVTVSTSSVAESHEKKYDRKDSIPNKLVVDNLTVINGQTKSYSYIKEQTFKYVTNIEEIKTIPILYLYTTPWNDHANEGVVTSIYKIGEYNINNAEKISIDTTTFKNKLLSDYVVNSGYKTAPNGVSDVLISALGEAHFGIVVIVTNPWDTGAGKFQLRHSSSVILSSNGHDDDDNHIFTYLLFRQNTTSKVPVFIPIKHDYDLWDKSTGVHGEKKLPLNVTKLSNYITKLCTNIRICTEKDAIKTGNLIKIQELETTNLPICSVSVGTPEFNVWNYDITESNSFDLLNFTSRNMIINRFSSSVCGNLLSGSVSKVDSIEFYKTDVENTNPTDVTFTISSNKNAITVQSQIAKINGQISAIENEAYIIDKVLTNAQTKGVYWMSGNNPKLIDLLNNSYAYNNDTILTAQSTNAANLNVYVTNDEDGIIYGLVDTNVTGKLDG